MDDKNDASLASVVEAARRAELIVFAGAGISMSARKSSDRLEHYRYGPTADLGFGRASVHISLRRDRF